MIIAHDLGTTGNKASLHHRDGTLIAAATVGYPVNFSDGGVAEQNPEDWWDAVASATRQLMSQSHVSPSDIVGIVVSGQMMGAVLLDTSMRPVRPAIIWADTRASKQQAQLSEKLGEKDAYQILGHRLSETYSLEKVMWVRDNEPEVWAQVHRVCVAKDYIVARMTGRLATDRSDASATNAYDQRTGDWSEDVLRAAGLEKELFPEILESIEVMGSVNRAAAAELGLTEGTSVVMGGGDGPLAAVGAGVVAPEDGAYVCLGTSSWVSFVSQEPVYDPKMRTFTFNNVVPDTFLPTATMQAGGASIQWIAEILSTTASSTDTDNLINAATEDVDTRGLYFLPYLLGERSPLWEPAARGSFLGLARYHTGSHLARAVMEGVVFNLLSCLRAFEECGSRFDRITAVGGGAQSDVLLQLCSDIWGIPVYRRSIVEEANSLGAAVTASVGLGLAEFSAARELSEITAEFSPRPEISKAYEDRYPLFLGAIEAVLPWFRRGQE
jgi:xylulokinase